MARRVKAGKTVANEKIKLRATFYSNLAVAGIISACVVPYISLLRATTALGAEPFSVLERVRELFTKENMDQFMTQLIVASLVFVISITLRKAAEEELEKLSD